MKQALPMPVLSRDLDGSSTRTLAPARAVATEIEPHVIRVHCRVRQGSFEAVRAAITAYGQAQSLGQRVSTIQVVA